MTIILDTKHGDVAAQKINQIAELGYRVSDIIEEGTRVGILFVEGQGREWTGRTFRVTQKTADDIPRILETVRESLPESAQFETLYRRRNRLVFLFTLSHDDQAEPDHETGEPIR